MTCRLARRLLATALSAALVLLSPGLEAPRLFAQTITRAVPTQGAHPVVALPAAPLSAPMSLTAPALSLQAAPVPSALSAAPAAAVAAPAATPAAALTATARAIAPQLEAVSKTGTDSAASRGAGQTIIDILTGARSAGSGQAAQVAAAPAAGISALSTLSAASAPTEPAKPSVPAAAAPAAPKTVDSTVSYGLRRSILKAVAAITGAVYSLPSAGPAITAKLVAQASDKRVVLSDYDDTLASYNQVLPQEMVEAIQAVKAAGKDFVVISDRGDEKRAHQLTVFESLASLPAETRAGMYVAANSGGRVYRYDEKGEPVRVFEVPALDEASKSMVAQAAEATKGRLKEVGAEQHFPSEGNNNPSESWGTYGYAMMLKVGSSEAAVRGAAAILEEELSKKGLKVEVNPRFAKDPANPPYINFSIVTKEASAGYIAKALDAQAKDVLVIGDSMYAPHEAKRAAWRAALAARASGRELPKTGNATDRNMEKALPGALTLGVGSTGDPRASNLWVLDGKGPAVTRRVLMSVASKPRTAAKAASLSEDAVAGLAVVAIIAAAAAGFYAMLHAFADIVAPGEQMMRGAVREGLDGMMMLGGMLGMLRGAKTGDDTAARYAALESEYSARLSKIPGVVGVKTRDSVHPFAGEINDIVGRRILVTFDGVPSLQKALADGVLPKTLPALDEIPDVAKYVVVPVVARKALKAAYAALEAGYAAELSRIPGVVGVKMRDSVHPIAGEINDIAGRWISVTFDGDASMQKAQESGLLPQSLPAIDGVDDIAKYSVTPVVAEPSSALKDFLAWLGAAAGVAAIYAAFFYAGTHAPVAPSGSEMLPAGFDIGRMFGGLLGAGMVTGSLAARKAQVEAMTLKQSVSPASPIEGFNGFVYDTALAAAREHAVELGAVPESLRVLGAKLSPRAWGEDWTFRFALPRVGLQETRGFDLTVRRTMVSETMVDAIDLKDTGRAPYFQGVPAELFASMVAVEPMAVVAKSGPGARTLALESRHGSGSVPAFWYVTRDAAGRELEVIDAKTGEPLVVDRRAGHKTVLFTLAAIAATVGIYAALFYAATHGPAASSGIQVPEGWQGPIPNDIDIGRMFGGVLGMAGVLGLVKGKSVPPPKVTDERVRAAAASVVMSKGMPWSQTEYNVGYYTTLENLKKDGATDAQIELYKKLCDEAPIRGGRFNPWSGD